MKNIVKAFALTLTVLLALAGCSSAPASDAAPASSSSAADPAAAWQSELVAPGTLTVGMCNDYPPYETLNNQGELVGFDVDMAAELAANMGLELVIKQFGFAEVITATQAGEVDVGISAFAYKPDRDVLFSTPYLNSKQVCVVTKASGYTTIADLSGKNIAAGTGTSCETAVQEHIPDAVLSSPGDYTIMFAALKNGAVDAVACGYQVAANYAAANDDLMVIEEAMTEEGTYVIAKKGNDALLEAVNAGLDTFAKADVYQQLLDKWEIEQ